ncbi:hypothetical protein M3Y99_02002500 [Aphelenchoides fujianensis]|nr:hypothetical protein M3Y99_02002500 [Aphelenchoides fujianensis]
MRLLRRFALASCLFILPLVYTKILPPCENKDMNCYTWVAEKPERCTEDEIVHKDCKRACGICEGMPEVDSKYDIKSLPNHLHKVAFLLGKWRSEFGGKARFPTMPKFTYGEQLDISYAPSTNVPMLNYTAFAWDNSDLTELHSESGFIAGDKNSTLVSMTTVMSNGFVTVESGNSTSHSIRFWLRNIGRLSFSRDLPVRRMLREWILLNETFLESRVVMATSTHPMLLHTSIIYKKIYP